MLTTLRIKNLALVTDLTLELRPGYNVITGETGAGKSILIGALNLVLGERADRGLIRSGADGCTVEAIFELGPGGQSLRNVLADNGLEPCQEDQLLLKRVLTGNGTNRQFVNGSPATLQALAEIGQWLVDIHGPHDHQSLLKPARQLAVLDAFGGLSAAVHSFHEGVIQRRQLEQERAAWSVADQTYAQQLDLLRHQVQEITAARLQQDEESRLEQDYQRASHGVRLLELSQAALAILNEDEGSVLSLLGSIGRKLQELHRWDSTAAPLLASQEQVMTGLRELQLLLSRYAEQMEVDPERLQQLEERLNLLQALKRKYGASVSDILDFWANAQEKLTRLEQREETWARLNAAWEQVNTALGSAGRHLSEQRRETIPRFVRAVRKQLQDLGFRQSLFDVRLQSQTEEAMSQGPLSPTGLDTIEFLFSPNPGEPVQPLRSIASSGELARVMLALKTVLAAEDDIPVLVFDEVDANIGGEIALAVGEKMQQIGRRHQVLCITHLAPVAVHAAAHYLVTKRQEGDRTISEVQLLGAGERIGELARMLGGPSEAARQHATALLHQINAGPPPAPNAPAPPAARQRPPGHAKPKG